jgi:Xaa-Pro aminopeptidase
MLTTTREGSNLFIEKSEKIARSNGNPSRRGFLRAGVCAGAAALTNPELGWATGRSQAGEIPPFPTPPEAAVLNSKEYGQKQIRKFQDSVRSAGLDALIISNRCLNYVGYFCNYHPSSMEPGVAFIPAQGTPILFVQMYSSAHKRFATKTLWIDDVIDVPKDPISETTSENFYKALVSTLKDRKLTRGRIGLSGGEVDWMLPPYLKSALPDLRIEDSNPLLWSQIYVKDEAEIALMRYTARISDEVAIPLIKKMLVPGTLDKQIFTEVLHAMMQAGADSSMLILGAAPYSAGIWATAAQNRPITKGDIVLCEPIVVANGFQTERMFTFAVGTPDSIPESQKRGAQVIYESFQIVLEEMKPGKELRAVYEKANNYIKSKGYPEGSTVLIGHFIGRNNHEGPRITSEGTAGIVLQPGMVISWHPNVVVPGDGGVRTICSSTLLITDKGVEMMSKLPMEPMVYVG